MKLTIQRHALSNVLNDLTPGLPSRPMSPILTGVRLVANGGLEGTATNYDVTITAKTGADVHTPGEVIVSGKLLADIAKTLPNEPVLIESDGSRVTVKAGAAKFVLLSMPSGEFPPAPFTPETVGTIDADVFSHAVKQAASCASGDQTLPLLTCVELHAEGGVLRLSATDRYRLSVANIGFDAEFTALVPAKVLLDAAKIFTGEINVGVSGTAVSFTSDSADFIARQFEGDYPPVMRLFPKSFESEATVDKGLLTAAVRRVALVAERNTPVILVFSDDGVTITAGQGDDAQASETLDAVVSSPIETAYNPVFLLNALSVIDGDQVRFGFTKGMKPAVLTGDGDFKYLLMPLRFGA